MYMCVCVCVYIHKKPHIWTYIYLRYSLSVLTLILLCRIEILAGEYNVVGMINCTPFCLVLLQPQMFTKSLHQQISISLQKAYKNFVCTLKCELWPHLWGVTSLYHYNKVFFAYKCFKLSLLCTSVWDYLAKSCFLQLQPRSDYAIN